MSHINVLPAYPDNDAPKAIFVQAAGAPYTGADPRQRHVLLYWLNARTPRLAVMHVHHLVGIPGRYAAETVGRLCGPTTLAQNAHFALGTFSRAQRDRIGVLAREVVFDPTSTVNNCSVWLRELLEAMTRDEPVARDIRRSGRARPVVQAPAGGIGEQ